MQVPYIKLNYTQNCAYTQCKEGVKGVRPLNERNVYSRNQKETDIHSELGAMI